MDSKRAMLLISFLLIGTASGANVRMAQNQENTQVCWFRGNGKMEGCIRPGEGINLEKDDYYFELQNHNPENIVENPIGVSNLLFPIITVLLVVTLLIVMVLGFEKVFIRIL